jgi:hypothetical protein
MCVRDGRSIQANFGAIEAGPAAEVLLSIHVDATGVHVHVFAHDPHRIAGGVLARFDARAWATLKSVIAEIDEQIASGRFTLAR